jgi:2-methylcitrate dehydratase PrpD
VSDFKKRPRPKVIKADEVIIKAGKVVIVEDKKHDERFKDWDEVKEEVTEVEVENENESENEADEQRDPDPWSWI